MDCACDGRDQKMSRNPPGHHGSRASNTCRLNARIGIGNQFSGERAPNSKYANASISDAVAYTVDAALMWSEEKKSE